MRATTLAWLRLVRFPLAPTAVCDSFACGLLALQLQGGTFGDVAPTRWLLVAATSLTLYLTGMAANDFADRARDRTLNPNRPLPSGALSARQAAIAIGLLSIGSLLLAHLAGSLLAAGVALAAALLYDFAVRRPWWLAALTMGSVRFANASLLVLPWVLQGDVTPAALIAPALIGLYSTAITVWSTTEEMLAPGRIHGARVLICAAFGAAAGVAWWAAGALPVGAVVAAGVVSSTMFGRTPREGPAKRQVLELLLGLYLLASVFASATQDGAVGWGFVALAVAWLLMIASQLAIRALARAR